MRRVDTGKRDWEIGRVEVEKRIIEVLEEMEKGMEKRNKKKGWDKDCRLKNRDVRKELREWTSRRGEKWRYRERKKEYRDLCERKKRENNEK